MGLQECDHISCGGPVQMHLTVVDRRLCVEERHLCEEHAESFVREICCQRTEVTANLGEASVTDGGTAKCFDVRVVAYSESDDPDASSVFLQEIGGDFYFSIRTGHFEVWMLRLALLQFDFVRPSVYHTLCEVLRTTGGVLQCVLIDRYVSQHNVFHAKLVILRDGESVFVDAKPSDAIILVVVSGIPIFVAEDVLKEMRL